MPIEEIVEKIEVQKQVIQNALNETDRLVQELSNSHYQEYDWVSVKKASKLLDISVNVIYNKIKDGKLEIKTIGTKKYVKRSEIVKINDKEDL